MDHPSPHMDALLDALSRRDDVTAHVFYCQRQAPERDWTTRAPRLATDLLAGIRLPGPLIAWNPSISRVLRGHPHVDIWLVNTCYTSVTTQQAIRVLHRRRIPWVYMNEPPRPAAGLKRWLQLRGLRPILRWADGFIGMSGEASLRYADLSQHYGHSERPCISVPYYIDVEPFVRIPRLDGGNPVRFLCMAQLIPRKGLDVLLAACRLLPATGWKLQIVGTGPLLRSLQSQAIGLPNVQFAGSVSYDRRLSVFQDADIFVLPSRWDGFGMVILEALAAGLPVISTDQVMSARDFVTPGSNGFLGPANDPQFLADRMRWFLDRRECTPLMSQAARRSVVDYRPESGANRLVGFLRQLTAGVAPSQEAAANLRWDSILPPSSPTVRVRQLLRRFAVIALSRLNSLRSRARWGSRILVYHLVLREDRKRFAEHLRFIKDHFAICSLEDVVCASRSPAGDHDRLAITFDDGFRVLMEDCLELLTQAAVCATFFVPAGFVALADCPAEATKFCLRRHHYQKPLAPMTPADLRQLVRLGHKVGSHTLTHASLSDLTSEGAGRELKISRELLEAWAGAPVTTFAYPYGHNTHSQANPIQWLEAAGYELAVTLRRGPVRSTTNRFSLPREHVEGSWPIRDVAYFLTR